jgi:hypothetical protein
MRLLAFVILTSLATIGATAAPAGRSAPRADCTRTSVGLTPLNDLKKGSYKGFQGGLYPNGANSAPARYVKQGQGFLKLVKPRAGDGTLRPGGKVVLLSVGMSNTTQEFSAFKPMADADPKKDPSLVVVDGAQGGQDAERVKDPGARFWQVIDQRLGRAGVTAAQVQVAWLKQAISGPSEIFPEDARRLQTDLASIVGVMRTRYANLRVVYVSSRIYAGYASSRLNPEPYAYQSGFAVKWLIQDRIQGRSKGRPWLTWGPYLWADGTRARSDGLTWACEDFRSDGTHPSPSGRRKVAERLLRFFETSSTGKVWFVR